MYDVIWESITLTFLAFAISYSMAKILAEQHNYHINENQVRTRREHVEGWRNDVLRSSQDFITYIEMVSSGTVEKTRVF